MSDGTQGVRRAVILVGGKGERLRPLTESTPKPMLPVLDRPLLSYTFDQLRQTGVEEAVLACGYLPSAIAGHYGRQAGGLDLHYRVEPSPLGTGGAVGFAAAGFREGFLVANGDTLRDVDLRPLVALHRRRRAAATILLTRVDDPTRYGVVETTGSGLVSAFREKPRLEEINTDLVNAGVYMLEPSVLDLIPSGRPVSIERDVFPQLAAERALYAVALDGYWMDVGTPASFVQAHLDLLERRGRLVVSETASVHESTRIIPPAGIGAGAIVGPEVTVGPGAYVSAGAVVGSGCVLERAVVLPNARLRSRSIARDTIVAAETELAA